MKLKRFSRNPSGALLGGCHCAKNFLDCSLEAFYLSWEMCLRGEKNIDRIKVSWVRPEPGLSLKVILSMLSLGLAVERNPVREMKKLTRNRVIHFRYS